MGRRGYARRKKQEPPVVIHDVYCKHETEKALLVTIQGEDYWLPKSQVHGAGLEEHPQAEVFDDLANSEGTIVLSQWIAGEKGLAEADDADAATAFDNTGDDIPF